MAKIKSSDLGDDAVRLLVWFAGHRVLTFAEMLPVTVRPDKGIRELLELGLVEKASTKPCVYRLVKAAFDEIEWPTGKEVVTLPTPLDEVRKNEKRRGEK